MLVLLMVRVLILFISTAALLVSPVLVMLQWFMVSCWSLLSPLVSMQFLLHLMLVLFMYVCLLASSM